MGLSCRDHVRHGPTSDMAEHGLEEWNLGSSGSSGSPSDCCASHVVRQAEFLFLARIDDEFLV